MQILYVLVGWTVLSVPAALVMGRVLGQATGVSPLPSWSAGDDQQLAEWREHSDH